MTARSLSKPKRSAKPRKPDKPRPDFSLTSHAFCKRCQKVRGKVRYFGSWADPGGVLRQW